MDIMKNHCCYLITNSINGRKYVGVTSNFNGRMANHKYKANHKLKADIDIHGWDAFTKEILFYGTENYCYSMEPLLIKEYTAYYNIGIGGLHGSASKGINNGNSKFTDVQIKNIRIEYAEGNITMVELATKYNSHNSYISSIIAGKFRVEAGGPINKESKVRKLTEDLVLEIREYHYSTREGYPIMAKKYNVGKTNIGKIIRGERWKSVGGPIKGVDYGF